MSECEACPVRGRLDLVRPCPGTFHPPGCEDVRRGVVGRAAQFRAVATGLPIEGHPADAGRIDPRLAMLADLCPMGSGPCGCGSGPPRICGDPDRPGHVWRGGPDGCISCVTRRAWEAGVESGG